MSTWATIPIPIMKAPGKRGWRPGCTRNVNEAGNGYRALGMSHLAGSAYRGVVNARLHSGMERFSPYYEVGYVYTGIYVMGFCQWIYRYAREHHLDKILFLAREGDLYRKVFTQMYPDFSHGICALSAGCRW